MENKLTDYGYANGWKYTYWNGGVPDVIEACPHELKVKNIGNCLNEYRCEICGYIYKVDSSG